MQMLNRYHVSTFRWSKDSRGWWWSSNCLLIRFNQLTKDNFSLNLNIIQWTTYRFWSLRQWLRWISWTLGITSLLHLAFRVFRCIFCDHSASIDLISYSSIYDENRTSFLENKIGFRKEPEHQNHFINQFRLLENKIGMRTEHRVRYNQSNYRR